MKPNRHPAVVEAETTCTSCGTTYPTRSTTPVAQVSICSNCHPFYTGRQKTVDTTGRVAAFRKKYRQSPA